MTLFVAMYLSLMGIEGLRKVNEMSYGGAHYLHDALIATGKFESVFNQPFLYEFCLRAKCDLDALDKRLEENGILGGVRCDKPGMEDCVLFAVTEKRTKEEIDRLISIVKEA